MFPSPCLSDSLLRLSLQSRLWQSLYALLSTGRQVDSFPCTLSECSRCAASLSRVLWDRLVLTGDFCEKLFFLSLLYDVETGTAWVADRKKTERWERAFEEAAGACFAETEAGDNLLRIRLCRCLADYFYFDPSPEEDDWFLFLRGTVRHWAATYSPATGWEGLPLSDALERVEVINRYSYMFLDPSADRVTAAAYDFYSRAAALSPVPDYPLWSLCHALALEGHALLLEPDRAARIVSRLASYARLHPEDGDMALCLLSCRMASLAAQCDLHLAADY